MRYGRSPTGRFPRIIVGVVVCYLSREELLKALGRIELNYIFFYLVLIPKYIFSRMEFLDGLLR